MDGHDVDSELELLDTPATSECDDELTGYIYCDESDTEMGSCDAVSVTSPDVLTVDKELHATRKTDVLTLGKELHATRKALAFCLLRGNQEARDLYAACIQRVCRGFLARRRERRLRRQRVEWQVARTVQQHANATLVQAAWRGHRVRLPQLFRARYGRHEELGVSDTIKSNWQDDFGLLMTAEGFGASASIVLLVMVLVLITTPSAMPGRIDHIRASPVLDGLLQRQHSLQHTVGAAEDMKRTANVPGPVETSPAFNLPLVLQKKKDILGNAVPVPVTPVAAPAPPPPAAAAAAASALEIPVPTARDTRPSDLHREAAVASGTAMGGRGRGLPCDDRREEGRCPDARALRRRREEQARRAERRQSVVCKRQVAELQAAVSARTANVAELQAAVSALQGQRRDLQLLARAQTMARNRVERELLELRKGGAGSGTGGVEAAAETDGKLPALLKDGDGRVHN